MPPRLRLAVSLLACILGPALAGIVVGFSMNAYGAATGTSEVAYESAWDVLVGAGLHAAFPVVFGTIPMLLIGLPIQAWMTRRGLTQVYWYVPTAALAGALIALAVLATGGPFVMAISAAYGGFAGLFAWLIRRPDRDRRIDAQAA
jgi:hypothetical protein